MTPTTWPWPGARSHGWTAVDISAEGALHAVSVRRGPAGRPQTLRRAHRAAGAPVAQALAEVAHQVGVAGFPWVLVMQRGDYHMLVLAEPSVLPQEMERSLRWSLGSLIDYPVDQAHVTWLEIPTKLLQPNRARQVYAIVAQHSFIEAQQDLFQKCKLKLQALDVRETAQRNIAALLEKKGNSEGLGLVHVAPTGVHITFTYGGELYLDRFIKQALNEMLAADEAQRRSMFEHIALQVSRSVDFIARNLPFMRVQRVLLAPLPLGIELHEYLVANLALPVERIELAQVFDLSLTPDLAAQDKGCSYFIALGAALRCLGSSV